MGDSYLHYFMVPVQPRCSPLPFMVTQAACSGLVAALADAIWCVNICSSLLCYEQCIIWFALTHFLSLAVLRLITALSL